MAEPFLGEVKLMSFNFAPKGWALANGQQLPINQNQALFSLFGTMYGGNGQTTFALPNLAGRMALHFGDGFTQGEAGGEVAHTLTMQEMPTHNHGVLADAVDGVANPTSTSRLANSSGATAWGPYNNLAPMNSGSITPVGGSQPHNNLQPYQVISFCVALQGIFPSRT